MKENFQKMILDFRKRISELQAPAVRSLSPEDFEALRRDKDLQSKSANYRLLGENDKADALESQILDLQQKVASIKEKLSHQPSGQREIYSTIANTEDSELHQLALKIYAAGLAEFDKTLKEIEASEEELTELHDAIVKNAKQRGDLERQKFNLYLRLREVAKSLPAEKHTVSFPERAPEWAHFLPDEDRIAKTYGQRPYAFRD